MNYATETALRAQRAGLKPYVLIFLSDDWVDFVKQPASAIWKEFSLEEKAAAIEAYAEKVARHLASKGVEVGTFEIGNEIDFGICCVLLEPRVVRQRIVGRLRAIRFPRRRASGAAIIRATDTSIAHHGAFCISAS